MVKIENKNGFKWITCENLGEVVEEFKKFRNSKSANERKNYSFGGFGGDFWSMIGLRTIKLPNGNFAASDIVDSAKIYQEKGVDLSLNLTPLNFKEADWKPYSQKIEKILKEIWETGEAKNYQGFDLNWPAVSQPDQSQHLVAFCDQCHKYIGKRELAWFSDDKKNLDFCSENCHSQFKEQHNSLEKENSQLKEQLRKEITQKDIWMAFSLVAVGLIFAATALVLVKRNKKSLKNK